MRPLRHFLAGAVLAILAVAIGAAPAFAHANLLSSDPKDGAELATAPSHVTLTFSEPVDVPLCLVTVLDTTGADIHAGLATAVPGQPRELSVSLPANLPKGVYTVNWRAVSAADGHITTKAFAFGIGTKPSATAPGISPPPAAPGPSVLAVAGKFLLYLGLAVLFAAGFVGTVAFGGAVPAHREAGRRCNPGFAGTGREVPHSDRGRVQGVGRNRDMVSCTPGQ